MSDAIAPAAHQHTPPTTFIRKYVFSLDHKVIGKQYYGLALVSVFLGMILSWLMRFHLVWTNAAIPGLQLLSKNGAPGGVMTPEYYLSLLTMHGTLMVFFVLTNAPFAGFGNYFLPIQVGAEDMAFPRFNMMSFWVTFVAFLVLVTSFFIPDGPPISGWTAYAPLSAVGKDAGPGLAWGQNLWAISIALFCIGQLLGSLNFIATTLDLRTKGMTLARLPICTWAWFITSCIGLLAFAVLLPACVLLILDRIAGTSFFIPAGLVISDRLQPHAGGSPLLWQHLFWFFGHPEVYIAIVPAMGIVSHILMASMRKPLLSSKAVYVSMVATGFLSYMVWGHHMFLSGMNPFSALVFSFPTLIITIPATIITMIWIGSIYGANLRFHTASLFSLGFISVFVAGGVSGFFLAQPSLDIYLHGTYFVVGHFHMVMGVAAIFGILAGTYFWFPKMTGRMMNETLGKLHFWMTFIGVYCIFMPFHYLGFAGNVRRYSSFVDDYLQPLLPVHKFVTIAAFLTGGAQLMFLFNLVYSRLKGAQAPDNPWQATSLEWATTSPPPFDNFGGRRVVVNHGPNEYGVNGLHGDFIMQDSPETEPHRVIERALVESRGRGQPFRNEKKSSLMLRPDRETSAQNAPTLSGVWVAVAATTMSFAAFTSSLIIRQGSGNDWRHLAIPNILYFNTAILMVSSVTLELARRKSPSDLARTRSWIWVTLVLGLLYLAGQVLAWRQLRTQGLYLATSPNSSFFYVLTVLHAVHVLGGLGGIWYVIRRLKNASNWRVASLDAAAVYWHFLAGLWVYVLLVLRSRI